MNKRKLVGMAAARISPILLILGLMFFLPAGTLRYWQAWVYIVTLFVPASFVVAFLIKSAPEFIERRMKVREKEQTQKAVTILGWPICIVGFLLPGFDRRYGWSSVPTALVVVADILVLASYLFIVRAFKENSYASRVVEVEQGQKVITTGPYALARHPVYLGMTVMFLFSPLALGSFWAMLPCSLIVVLFVPRIFNEEKVLTAQLEGYKEYKQHVRFRLIPGIW
jgi:protein-S-isoprenylcysteine O-methyltransferase Ste14